MGRARNLDESGSLNTYSWDEQRVAGIRDDGDEAAIAAVTAATSFFYFAYRGSYLQLLLLLLQLSTSGK